MSKSLLIVLAWLMLTTSAQGASFDCKKARTKVEKLICASAELSKLDEELDAAYKTALKNEGEEQDKIIRESQKNWIKYRDNCKDAYCIRRAYEMRLSSLTVTHIYAFSWGETDEEMKAAGFTSGTIDMRKPVYPFELKEGKGVEVCDIYKKNLVALGYPNLACERKVSPEYAGILKLPGWRKLDLWENRNLWAQVEKMANSTLANPGLMASKDTGWDDQYQVDVLAKDYQGLEVYKLDVANIDINNDGKNELILRDRSGLCGEPVHYKSIALFVLNEKGGYVDLQKSRPLFQDPWYNVQKSKLEASGVFSSGSMYDVFFYKDKTYFDRWTETGIWIYQISNGETEAICHLK